MKTNRREFVAAGLGASAGLGATLAIGNTTGANAADAAGKTPLIDGFGCLDYGRSFICNTASFNAVRFWVESRTIVIDGPTAREFYQCGSCKSENTFAEKNLFAVDNYDFLPILGDGHWLVFRRLARLSPDYRQFKPTSKFWGDPVLKFRYTQKWKRLDTWDEIRAATDAAIPIVARTEFRDDTTGLRAIIEYPIKTMNVSLDKKLYQIDTGPVAFPDLTRRYSPHVDSLRLAFVAFNAPDFADFVIEQPTTVVETDRPASQTYHYSAPFSIAAKNSLFALEDT